MSKAIMIVGPKRSGKTTFGRALAEAMGIPFGDTGDVISSKLKHYHKRLHLLGKGTPLGSSKELRRPYLIAMGDALCLNDPTCLIRAACDGNPLTVVAGVRRIEEFNAAKEMGLIKSVYWIEGSHSTYGLDNLTINRGDAENTIDNNGTLNDLEMCAKRIAMEEEPRHGDS